MPESVGGLSTSSLDVDDVGFRPLSSLHSRLTRQRDKVVRLLFGSDVGDTILAILPDYVIIRDGRTPAIRCVHDCELSIGEGFLYEQHVSITMAGYTLRFFFASDLWGNLKLKELSLSDGRTTRHSSAYESFEVHVGGLTLWARDGTCSYENNTRERVVEVLLHTERYFMSDSVGAVRKPGNATPGTASAITTGSPGVHVQV